VAMSIAKQTTSNVQTQSAFTSLLFVTVKTIVEMVAMSQLSMHVESLRSLVNRENGCVQVLLISILYKIKSLATHFHSLPGLENVCVPISKICDDNLDCPNGADEGPECDSLGCAKHTCSNGCTQTPVGPLCTCPEGEVINPNSTNECQDLDECSPPGICSQVILYL